MFSIAMWVSEVQQYRYLVDIDTENNFTLWSANPECKRLEFKTTEEANLLIKNHNLSKCGIIDAKETAK